MKPALPVIRIQLGLTGICCGSRERVMTDETEKDGKSEQVESLLATPNLSDALESEQFRRFLDQVPIAVMLSEMGPPESIVYANPEFEKVAGQFAKDLVGKPWIALQCNAHDASSNLRLGAAIAEFSDFVGTFVLDCEGREPEIVDAYSNVIEDNDGTPTFRFAALVRIGAHEREELERQLREKDALLKEIQHRVKNNLQMITALMRLEARNAQGLADTAPFRRLAGRIEAMKILYSLLSDNGQGGEIDLGVYLSEIATAVLHTHAVEGIRLNLKVDAYPVSVNVAMPTGLVVNELLTNTLKHAFIGRDGGAITLESVSDGNGCRIIIADDGVGLPAGVEWPKRGKLSSLIVQSLRENAKAKVEVESAPGQGMRVKIVFTRAAAAPEAPA
jgi:two-component sensor histidine kinase